MSVILQVADLHWLCKRGKNVSTYVISDIHGEYGKFMELLRMIDLKPSDDLYVLGDVLDRGPHPIRCLLRLMSMPNALCLLGNHELMAAGCLGFLMKEITDKSIEEMSEANVDELLRWAVNGSRTTIDEFYALDRDQQEDVLDFLHELPLYEELTVGGQDYLLVHSGLGNYSPDRALEDYSLDELLWQPVDCSIRYFDDIITISGHTPTQLIEGNKKPGYIYRANNHIAIDCGACFEGGRLAALCLDTGEEFYAQ